MVVSLVALPLCLGIAIASGAEPIAGLITGILGGIVVGVLSGSNLSVSGPAAGLTVIVLNGIQEIGTFEGFLLALVLAGAFQLLMGIVKAGIIGMYFPSSVIKGMLAAIGIILILKEIPHFFGFDDDAFGEMSFLGTDGRNTFEELFYAFNHIHYGAFIIGVISLIIMIAWDSFKSSFPLALKIIPGALLAVIFGIVLNESFFVSNAELFISGNHLVQLPIATSLSEFKNLFATPDFTQISNPIVWKTAFVVAVIASLETLLSLEAVDKLDPMRHHSPKDQELKAQGIGNLIAGFIGGIPMTAVIVRSSANIGAGGKTKTSAVFHGILLLLAFLFIPHLINKIPLSALAAVLLIVGFKLTKPELYIGQIKNGHKQYIPFLVTIIAILFSDLLIGILIGLSVGVFYILHANFKTPYHFKTYRDEKDGRETIVITLSEHVSFLNKANIQKTLENTPDNALIIIDGTKSTEIDFDALVIIDDFKKHAYERNIEIIYDGVPKI